MSVPNSPFQAKSGALNEPPEDDKRDQEAPERQFREEEESMEAYENR